METIIILAALNCYGLSHDQQAYCQARQHNDVGYCYSISDQALRTACRAELHDQPDICSSTIKGDRKDSCENGQ